MVCPKAATDYRSVQFSAQDSKSRITSACSPLWGAFLLVEIQLQVTELVVNCVTSCHLQSKLCWACQKKSSIRLERRPGGPLAARDCALELYKYAIFSVSECRMAVQKVVNIA